MNADQSIRERLTDVLDGFEFSHPADRDNAVDAVLEVLEDAIPSLKDLLHRPLDNA